MAIEDADVIKIRRFVTESLESVDAIVEFREYNYAEVLIPDDLLDFFDGQNYFSLSFDYDVAKQHKDSELVTYGSYFLDRVIELASQIGITCKQHIIDENLELKNLPQKIEDKIVFRNCKAIFVANTPMIYHYVLFNFKVSYISDERVDRIVKVLVNLNTGYIDNEMLKAIGSAFFTDSPHTNYDMETMISTEDAYHIATPYLEEQIQHTIRELNIKIDKRLIDDKKRIMEYYDQADNELKLKREKLVQNQKDEGLKSIDDKLRLNEIERQRRIKEIEEKNALKVSVMLFNASLISQTKIRNRYNIKRGKTDLEVYVVWNPLLNNVDPIVCEICHKGSKDIEICSNSHIGCPDCVHSCSVCNLHLCKNCGMTECSVCGDHLCNDCKIVCENCGDVLCQKHVDFCTCKKEKRRKEKELAEQEARKKQEAEEQAKEAHILEFRDIPLRLSESMMEYHDSYVRRHINELNQDWKTLMVDAQSAMSQKENVKARSILRKLDTEYPGNAWVKANLILTYERWVQDLALLGQQTVRLAPNKALAHTAMAHAYELDYRYQPAIHSYEQAIKLSEKDETELVINALFKSGNIFYRNGELQEAERRWRIALSLNPRFSPARNALEKLRRQIK